MPTAYSCTISRDHATIVCILKIGTRSQNSENAQCNLEIAQILRLCGTYILVYLSEVDQRRPVKTLPPCVSFSRLLVHDFYLDYCSLSLSILHVTCSHSSLQSNGERVAVKMFTGGVEFRALKREIEVVCALPHQENIVKMFGVEEEVSWDLSGGSASLPVSPHIANERLNYCK